MSWVETDSTPVHLEEDQIRGLVKGKTILVTGAGGSIGSELCRQIAHFKAGCIVGFEIAESPLSEIDCEMREVFPQVTFYPEIGSIQNRARVDEVLLQYRPSVVYHAAGYKHNPMMEAHVFQAIRKNVFGTYTVAEAAADCGVNEFVMISSDAVASPNNILGVTKRIAELLLLALQSNRTKCVAVRLENAVGSNGSANPNFKSQIAAGGPVTVAPTDMQRSFITIPDACRLVLQASAIGESGQICVLDIGEPLKRVDLARNLSLLPGLLPDQDIKPEFTDLRSGEMLNQEPNAKIGETTPTPHEKVRVLIDSGVPEIDMLTWLYGLHEICETRDASRLVVALKEVVPGYSPSITLLEAAGSISKCHSKLPFVLSKSLLAKHLRKQK